MARPRTLALPALLALTLAACTDPGGSANGDAAPSDSQSHDGHVVPLDGTLPGDGLPPADAAPQRDTGPPRDAAPHRDAAPDTADGAPLTCASGAYSCAFDDGGSGYCCGTACVDIYSDHAHCGDCANACDSAEVCLNGYCVATSCTGAATNAVCLVSVGVTGTCCDGVCRADAYFHTSDANCNSCGLHCASGAACTEVSSSYGQCLRAGSSDWCGYDGAACPTGTACVSGQSACLVDSCQGRAAMYPCALADGAGQCCSEACTNIYYDPENCGSCGHVCPANTWCNYGTCVATQACDPLVSGAACEISTTHPGVCCGGACVDPTTDSSNCNQCGNLCPLGSTCEGRACKTPDGESASCRDAGCPTGTFCNYYSCWSPTCAPGSSGQVCAFGPSRTGTCCDGVCVDLQQDPGNCGSCNHDCGGQWCVGGTCFSDAPATSSHQACSYYSGCPAGERCDYSNHCVNCSDWLYGDDFCYGSQTCFEGRCLEAGCSSMMPPGATPCVDLGTNAIGICCGGFFNPRCVDILTDANNCGECDRRCPTGSTCVGGDCSVTPLACRAGHHAAYCDPASGPSSVCCAEGCVDLESSDANCGACGYACGAGLSCVDQACIALTCTAALEGQSCARTGGVGTCCGSVCVDRSTDESNCGSCGHYCPASMSCKGGACGLDVCDAGHVGSTCHVTETKIGLCCPDGCVDTKTDSQNCGGCEQPCPGSTTCQGGACHL
jgi:hypothetical protein